VKHWRPFRFPPLGLATATLPGLPGDDPVQLQASVADGFRQGMDAGYREGFDAGEQAGRDAGHAQGLAEGRVQGFEAARREVLSHFDGLAAPLEAAAEAMRRTCEDYQGALREDVVELVAKVARQVIRCELTLKPAQILDLVEETLAALPPVSGDVEVLLNAEECARIRELAPERAARWRLVPDAKLASGECRVRTAQSEADAGCQQRLEACLDKVREQLGAAAQQSVPSGVAETDAVAEA
jgi:flagellar assembly protein FliH